MDKYRVALTMKERLELEQLVSVGKAVLSQVSLEALLRYALESMEMLGAMPQQASPPPQGPCSDTSA